jgi:hypothetical protein
MLHVYPTLIVCPHTALSEHCMPACAITCVIGNACFCQEIHAAAVLGKAWVLKVESPPAVGAVALLVGDMKEVL